MTCSATSHWNAFAAAAPGMASIFHPVLPQRPEILQSRPGRSIWKHTRHAAGPV